MKHALPTIPDISGKTVLIIGCPASGKTTLANALKETTGAKVIHGDDYMVYGYKEAMYEILSDLIKNPGPVIVEGVQGYRLLRKGVELDAFYPDMVIELSVTSEQVEKVYKSERSDKKLKHISGFNKMIEKVLSDYRSMPNPKPPQWVRIENQF